VVQTSRTNGLGRSSNASRLSGRGGGVTACPGVLAGASGPRPPWAAPLPAVCRLNLADDRGVFLSRITCQVPACHLQVELLQLEAAT